MAGWLISVELLVQNMDRSYLMSLINAVGKQLDSTKRLGFYLKWIECVFKRHTMQIRTKCIEDTIWVSTLVRLRQRLEVIQKNIVSL
jgi:hypothetical protein